MVFNEHLLSPLPATPDLILTFILRDISSFTGDPKAYTCSPHTANHQEKADNRSQSKPHPPHHPASCCRLTAQLPRCAESRKDSTSVHRATSDPNPDLSYLQDAPFAPLPPGFPRGAEASGAQSPPRVARHPSRGSRPHYSVWAAIQQQAAQIHRPKEMQTRRRAKQRSR